MRADARDNRARIMTAADEVFGRSPSASTDDVARLAGVGIATVFRHFPTKTELLEAVLTLRLERLRDRALELADSDDPGTAFFGFFTQVVSESASKLAIAEALAAAGTAVGADAQKAGQGMREAFDGLLTRGPAGRRRTGGCAVPRGLRAADRRVAWCDRGRARAGRPGPDAGADLRRPEAAFVRRRWRTWSRRRRVVLARRAGLRAAAVGATRSHCGWRTPVSRRRRRGRATTTRCGSAMPGWTGGRRRPTWPRWPSSWTARGSGTSTCTPARWSMTGRCRWQRSHPGPRWFVGGHASRGSRRPRAGVAGRRRPAGEEPGHGSGRSGRPEPSGRVVGRRTRPGVPGHPLRLRAGAVRVGRASSPYWTKHMRSRLRAAYPCPSRPRRSTRSGVPARAPGEASGGRRTTSVRSPDASSRSPSCPTTPRCRWSPCTAAMSPSRPSSRWRSLPRRRTS